METSLEKRKAFEQHVRDLTKAELHLHIEGTLEPDLLMQLAKKNGVSLPYTTVAEVQAAYNFSDLQSFLDLYYLGASVLQDSADFEQLMWLYLCRCRDEGIVHTEMMFDPQTHTTRGISFDVFMDGFQRAMSRAQAEWGQSSLLIMCFLRHLPEADAIATLAEAEPFRHMITAVGLDSGEIGNPPEKFEKVFRLASEQGYRLVAHAGEEGPPAYIRDVLDVLHVERIDHGVRCLEDDALVARLVREQVPLTVCPLSNVRLRVFDDMSQHPLLKMLAAGLNVTVNADDPPYFGGYLLDNYMALYDALGLDQDAANQLAANSLTCSFLTQTERQSLLSRTS